MSAGSPDQVYADVQPAGHTMFRKRPKWRIKIIDGIIVHGPATGSVVIGWVVAGTWEEAAEFAQKKLERYIEREWPEQGRRVYRKAES